MKNRNAQFHEQDEKERTQIGKQNTKSRSIMVDNMMQQSRTVKWQPAGRNGRKGAAGEVGPDVGVSAASLTQIFGESNLKLVVLCRQGSGCPLASDICRTMISFVVVALCAAVLGAPFPAGGLFPKESFSAYNINIGTQKDKWDVMINDVYAVADRNFDSNRKADELYEVSETEALSSFWIAQNTTAKEQILMQLPVVSIEEVKSSDAIADNNVVSDKLEAKVVSWGKSALRKLPQVDDEKAKDLEIGVEYSCHAAGKFLVTVNLRFFKMSDSKDRSHKDSKFSLLKKCKEAEKAVKGVGLPDFYIGTSPDLKDVVNNGETTGPYLIKEDDQDENQLTIVQDTEFFSSFYLRFHPTKKKSIKKEASSFEANEPQIASSDPGILLVESLGELSYGGTVDSDAKDLTLKFICRKEGSSVVTVTISSEDFPDFSAVFSFKKLCSGAGHAEGVPIPGLNIGTKKGLSDVVKDGLTAIKFRNLQVSGEKIKRVEVNEDVEQSEYHLTLSDSDGSPERVKFMRPILVNADNVGGNKKVVEPMITGSITRANSITSEDDIVLKVQYNCLREGTADVSVEIPLRPKGALQFVVRKKCTYVEEAPAEVEKKKLPGFNVGSKKKGFDMVAGGITQEAFAWGRDTDLENLKRVPKAMEFMSFYLSKNSTKGKPIYFGPPEIISSLDIFYPVISGRGSSGGKVSGKSGSHFTITFHCLTNGTSLVTMIIPFVGADENEPPVREEPAMIYFLKDCPKAGRNPKAESKLGGVYMKGFSVDTDGQSADIVQNGFPTAMYFGQRKRKEPDWEEAIIPKTKDSISLKIHLSSEFGDSNEDEVQIGKISTVSHHSMAKPVLSGTAVNGGTLELDGEALTLDIVFNCQFKGLAAISVIIPIVPHGSVTFTIPKECEGAQHPARIKIPGMFVQVLNDQGQKQDVVKDGVTVDAFSPFIDEEETFIVFYDTNTTFFIERKGDPITGLEPIVICHRSWCVPEVKHELPRPEDGDYNKEKEAAAKKKAQAKKKKSDGEEEEDEDEGDAMAVTTKKPTKQEDGGDPDFPASVEVKFISGTQYKLVVVYHCIYGGQSPVSLTIPMLPVGTVTFTWTVVCPETEDYFDDDFYSYLSEMETPLYDSAASNYASLYSGDDYYYQPSFYYDDDIFAASDLSDDNYWYDELSGYSVLTEIDTASYSSFINVGTAKTEGYNNDVVNHGIPQPQWELACKEDKICKVFSSETKETTFYVSLESGTQDIDVPVVKATNNKNDKRIVMPKISGSLTETTVLEGGASYELKLEFNCKLPGVTVVHIAMPLLPAGAMQKQVAFSFLKICGGFVKKEDFSWTASRGLNLAVVLLIGMALLGPYCWFKKKGATAGYKPVSKTGNSVEMTEDNNVDIPEDDYVDSESD
eukprot:g31516.t1